MYHDFEVEIPNMKGKIIAKKKGHATYILFQYGHKYNPEKQYAVPQRSIIGKVNPDHTSHMFPNVHITDTNGHIYARKQP